MSLRTVCVLAAFCAVSGSAQEPFRWEDGLSVFFGGLHGQIEVGGPHAAMEFHGSRPLPSRISFYSPVANSIDVSTDYWRRGESRPFVLGVRVDGGPKRWLGKEPWEYVVSPHTVRFERAEGDLRYAIRYEFCVTEPAAVVILSIDNAGATAHSVELYSHLLLALRSCQTYTRFDTAWTRFEPAYHAVVADFDDSALAAASVIVQNAGSVPVAWERSAAVSGIADSGWSVWENSENVFARPGIGEGRRTPAAAAFNYRLTLEPGADAEIVQIFSSVARKDVAHGMERLARRWKAETAEYDRVVRGAATGGPFLRSGDAWTDSSVIYSLALLAANRHHLDGELLPMPCPAEYNFFFTHDALLTDLAAVAFDPDRVKADLMYIAGKSRDGIIPHAYYWKDDGYKTEYCSPGNWNHLWFILTCAAYLRHTMDTATVARLYPLMEKSLGETLKKRSGNIMLGVEPDWWDFGHAEGQRAYLTILTIRALEEYVFVSARLGKNIQRLASHNRSAEELRGGLVQHLWDEKAGYLLNFTGALQDRHVYMGPLQAAAYGVLPQAHARRLVATAGEALLDSLVGVRTVSPADFHTDSVKQFYKVKGNEAGDPYLYANGGVWYLGNAWYAAALKAVGQTDQAFAFYRNTMTIDGILRSPQGQPALYEYRFADRDAAEHGRVDKPTMMWSAGFCVGTAYRMIGFEENVWNIAVAGAVPSMLDRVSCTYVFGKEKTFDRTGRGARVTRVKIDDREIPSRVLPLDAAAAGSISVAQGPIRYPYLDRVNAVLHSASFDPAARRMSLELSSFGGHGTTLFIVTPWISRAVSVNGQPWRDVRFETDAVGTVIVRVHFPATAGVDTVTLQF